MWNRKDLKAKGRAGLNRNYWKTVLISFLVAILAAGGGGGSSAGIGSSMSSTVSQQVQDGNGTPHVEERPGAGSADLLPGGPKESFPIGAAVAIAGIVTVVILVALAIAFALSAFIGNPVEVGGKRFFVTNLNRKAEIGELGFAFDHNYMNIVKTMFMRDIYTLLWGLLFIIPGIVKSYEYRMIPYLLTEHPDLTKEEAFARSRAMMSGQKWKAFVLDLSFIGWEILSAMTLGILHVFYVKPYRDMTDAALYEALAYGTGAGENVSWTES